MLFKNKKSITLRNSTSKFLKRKNIEEKQLMSSEEYAENVKNSMVMKINMFKYFKNNEEYKDIFDTPYLSVSITHMYNNEIVGVSEEAYDNSIQGVYAIPVENYTKFLKLVDKIIKFTNGNKQINKELLFTIAFVMHDCKYTIETDGLKAECNLEDGTNLRYSIELNNGSLKINKSFYNLRTKQVDERTLTANQLLNGSVSAISDMRRGYTSFSGPQKYQDDYKCDLIQIHSELDINSKGQVVKKIKTSEKQTMEKDENGVYKITEEKGFDQYPFTNYTETEEIYKLNDKVAMVSHTIDNPNADKDHSKFMHSTSLGSLCLQNQGDIDCRGNLQNISHENFEKLLNGDKKTRQEMLKGIDDYTFSVYTHGMYN